MLVDLVQTTTRDGLRLDGAFIAPPHGRPRSAPLDGVCLVHGTGGNFYGSSLFDAVAECLLELGSGVLRVNTRGHDGISTSATERGGKRLGAAYEIVDDCRYDVAAWLDWLRRRVGPRVGLLGHSLGAVKALYALASEPEPLPACLIAVSPPRLSYTTFVESENRQEFLETYQNAERLVEQNQPQTLLDVKQPLPFAITAAGYVEKYGPDERYNFLKFVSATPCPTLLTFGGIEVQNNMAFRGLPGDLSVLGQRFPKIHVAEIPDADHFYTGKRRELAACLKNWLGATLQS